MSEEENNYIKEGTEFLDQLKDRVHDLYDENKELKEEIERLNKENTILRQNSQYLVKQKDELEVINKTIEYIEENCSEHGNEDSMWFYRTINADNVLNILKGVDKE